MRYLSLFSGIGGFECGIHSTFEDAHCVGYSEIDKGALGIYRRHYGQHIALGDVKHIMGCTQPLDLMVAGFPCTDLSIANVGGSGLEGSRSGLFYEALRLLKLVKPKWWVFENVDSMKSYDRDIISGHLGVSPVMIDAASVSAQSRKRLFWANFKITQIPEPSPHKFVDLLLPADDDRIGGLVHTQGALDFMSTEVRPGITHWDFGHHFDTNKDKCACLIANLYKGQPNNVLIDRRFGTEGLIRKLHPIEVERIMGFPDNWTLIDNLFNSVTYVVRYKTLGNSVSVPVVRHIMQCLKEQL